MKFLVVGCGSIGRRHARNLSTLGYEVITCDISPDNRAWMERELKLHAYEKLSEALAEKPDAALVCTPTSTHVQIALEAIEAGAAVFVEKPVADSLQGAEKIMAAAEKKSVKVQVGYNLRFVPALAKMKELVQSGAYGKVLCARAIFAQYLPYWRPGTDYTKGYTGKKKMGGGLILEASHELDYLCWILGKPALLSCLAKKTSSLSIDTEDTAEISLEFESGAIANVHLDFVRQDYTRGCEIVCEKGTLTWKLEYKGNRNSLEVRTYDLQNADKITVKTLLDVPWDNNYMYNEEIKSFIACLKAGTKPSPGMAEGKLALQLAIKALESSENKRYVAL